MTLSAVTFDFHNTLAICDDWFELEIRTLVQRVLERQARLSGATVDEALLNNAVQSYRALRRTIIAHGDELDALACSMYVLQDIGVSAREADVADAIEDLMRVALDGSEPVPGSLAAIRTFAEHGIVLGVVSSAVYHPFLEWSLEKFGVLDAFRVIVTSASAGFYKTRPELYWHTLEILGTEPAKSVHIGDSYEYDVVGAARAGMRTVWFARDSPNGVGNDADLTVTTLAGVADLVIAQFGGAG
jgi:FMN phosphatase YigB (HAD superfamily)